MLEDGSLPAIAGVLLSLGFTYIPGMSDWYEKLTAQQKSLLMLGLLLLACVVILGASCLGYSNEVACAQEDVKKLFLSFVTALVANQSTYLVTKNL